MGVPTGTPPSPAGFPPGPGGPGGSAQTAPICSKRNSNDVGTNFVLNPVLMLCVFSCARQK